jgi:DNA topoisomerase-1
MGAETRRRTVVDVPAGRETNVWRGEEVANNKAPSGRRLVIVESPKKARTIAGYLGPDFDVEASIGHIRDLPQPSELPAEMKKGPFGKFAVDVENGFEAYYVVDADKKKKVSELKRALREADELFLATDEDREGEAIAWHLLQVLEPKVPVRRMVFHEITREALARALRDTRDLDERLVDAQETRRILDRLYGYEVSPVLWRKVRAGLSAGRVQSVATRLVVERERERIAFRAASYWDVSGLFAPLTGDTDSGVSTPFGARLVSLDGTRVATGRDFDDSGQLTDAAVRARVLHLNAVGAQALVSGLDGIPASVTSVEEKPYTRRPAAPFTTSTLQQEASRKLRLSSRQTMRVAQSLYENGYITYMRTDSTQLSTEAVDAARRQASQLYGPDYVPDRPRVYTSKAKNAQEAHEAIRPAGDNFRTPAQVSGELRGDEFRLYELIWKRTIASQMADARGSTATVRLAVRPASALTVPRQGGDPLQVVEGEFSASGTVITFRGFLAAYEEGRDDERKGDGDESRRLPELRQGQRLDTRELSADGHETVPPPRYTEASLIKALEERGIGRPSTYAATISTILDRGYVNTKGNALVPTWLAFSVTRLLEEHFGRLVDYDFTAVMEEDLDRIASGQEDRKSWLSRFYFGSAAGTSATAADRPAGGAGTGGGLKPLVDNLGEIDPADINRFPLGDGLAVRVGKYGPYLEAPPVEPGGPTRTANIPDGIAPDELSIEKALELLEAAAQGDLVLGTDPATGRQIVGKSGRFGPYVTEVLEEGAPKSAKPRTASLFKSAARDHLAGRRTEVAHAAAAGRRRAGHGRGDHRAERPLWPVPEEGDGLAVAHRRGPDLRHHPRRGSGDLRAAEGSWPPVGRGSAARAGPRPGLRWADRRQGRPVRPVCHGRRDKRHPAQGRRRRVDLARAGGGTDRREAGQGSVDGSPPDEEGGRRARPGGRQEDDGQEDRYQDGYQDDRSQDDRSQDGRS